MDFYYQGSWRMDWGFGNPNKTAVFIACLMVAVWLAAGFWRRGFWLALPICTALGCCLVRTYSRGGMLALIAGITILLVWAPRPWPRARVIAAVAAIWVLALFIICAKAEARYGQGLFSDDPSIDSRLIVWRHFPEMLAAAPWGWGWGQAGDAYTQWYQPTEQSIHYLNLLNSHFTWMAEGGWAFSLFYMAAWCAVIVLCRPECGEPPGAVPLAVWVALGVGGFFSQVGDSTGIWVLPILLFALAIAARIRRRAWPAWRSMMLGGLVSGCALVAIISAGCVAATLPIKAQSGAILIGRGGDEALIYIDRGVMGKLYGHTLRRYLADNAKELFGKIYMITEAPNFSAPANVSQIIVGGKMAQNLLSLAGLGRVGQLVLINPSCFPEEMHWNGSAEMKACVYFGEYAQSLSRSSWETRPGVQHLVIEGAGDFVPAWPDAIWKPAGT